MDDRPSAVDARFDRLAGLAAIAAALVTLVYSIAFVVIESNSLAAIALLAGGLLSAVALVGAYEHVRAGGPLARLGLLLGFVGTLGAAIHGAYDLANVLHPPDMGGGSGPFPVDPRGFLTFGVAGLGLIALSWAGLSVAGLPRPLLLLGVALGVLLIVIFLGRLIVLDPSSILILAPAALAGVVVGPLWYGWLGYVLLTGSPG